MPLFGKKKKETESKENGSIDDPTITTSNGNPKSLVRKPRLSFQCQLAHGSPTGLIAGFTNIKELYTKIAECYEIDSSEILFCTLNTHKVDMEKLLGSHIGLDDFIFVHLKGQRKEIDLKKNEDTLGLTITDNGCGKALIKRIKESSHIYKMAKGLIDVGDHIESIDDESYIEKRHYHVAQKLRSLSVGSQFTLRLISPQRSIYSSLSKRSDYSPVQPNIVSGRKTIRFTCTGEVVEEDESAISSADEKAVLLISRSVEKSLGIEDTDIARNILSIGKNCKNPAEFHEEIYQAMGEFQFSNAVMNDFWGTITDLNDGRLSIDDNGHDSLTSSQSTEITKVFEERF